MNKEQSGNDPLSLDPALDLLAPMNKPRDPEYQHTDTLLIVALFLAALVAGLVVSGAANDKFELETKQQ